MKPIAIHAREGSFSDRWITYCTQNGIPHRVVNCYDSDIIGQLRSCSALLWHFGHGVPSDLLIARHVLGAATAMGLVVFPDHATNWHFDDKVAQKYILEAVGAPLVPAHVFFDANAALAWIEATTFPKVFKLRRGSGSRNVLLVRTASRARRLVRKAFARGFRPSGTVLGAAWKVPNAWRKRRLVELLVATPGRLRHRWLLDARLGRESGYAYFQDYMPGNRFDTRVTIIGERAFGFTRDVRPGDFRASGSGRIVYGRVRRECVDTAFRVSSALRSQSVAFDFLEDANGVPLVGEISYGYDAKPVHDCNGYWDSSFVWHEGAVWPEHAIIADTIARVRGVRAQ